MKVSKISLVVGIGAVSWIGMSVQRWWFTYPDLSQLIFALGIGLNVLAFAYIYNWMRRKDEQDGRQNERLNAVVDFWMSREKEAILERAKGMEADL